MSTFKKLLVQIEIKSMKAWIIRALAHTAGG